MAKKKKDAPQEVQRDLLPIEEPAPEFKIVEGTSPEPASEPRKLVHLSLNEEIQLYAEQNPQATEQQIVKHFGLTLRVIRKALAAKQTPEERTKAAQEWITDSKTEPETQGETVAKKKKAAVKKAPVLSGTNKKKGPSGKKTGRVAGVNKKQNVIDYAKEHPDATRAAIAEAVGCSMQTVQNALGSKKRRKGKGGRPKGSTNKAKATRAAGNEVGDGHTGSQHGFISAAFAMGLDKAQQLLDRAKELLG